MALNTKKSKVDIGSEVEFKLPDGQVRRRRIPELLTGILLVFVGALLFLFLAGGDPTRPVAVMANDVARGEVIEESDLVQVELASSIDVNAVDWISISQIVGARASSSLVSGQVVTLEDATSAPDLPEGFRGLGVILNPGSLPTSEIGAGDLVDVISVLDEGEATTLARKAPIRAMGSAGDVYWLTLVIPEADAEAVAAAAHNETIRLSTVPAQ